MSLQTASPIEQHDGYTIQHFAPIELGGKEFTVREQRIEATGDHAGSSTMWITGPRGADYTLEPTGRPGVYVAQSWSSGQPMRRQGNVVLIHWLGDIIEQA
ncbi:hypothetical protein AA0Z99_00235 [Agrococcus sp. 1P02AA]|uniref:hypothetical protein n=1 Tax=Agrococcus sp. 1P02AA TaxID=3132259 RepID=UPI0039A5ED0A